MKRKQVIWKTSYWGAMARCNNPNNDKYPRYGGRGIRCKMKMLDFKYIWERDKGYLLEDPTVDRRDNEGNYTIKNCRYIERVQNTRKDHLGFKHTSKTRELIREKTLKRPVIQIQNGAVLNEYSSMSEASRKTGVNVNSIKRCCEGKFNHAGGFQWIDAKKSYL